MKCICNRFKYKHQPPDILIIFVYKWYVGFWITVKYTWREQILKITSTQRFQFMVSRPLLLGLRLSRMSFRPEHLMEQGVSSEKGKRGTIMKSQATRNPWRAHPKRPTSSNLVSLPQISINSKSNALVKNPT